MKARQKKHKRWKSAAARRFLELAGNPPTVEKAVELVGAQLLQGICCPPTDLEALGLLLKVNRFEPVDGLPISGELRKDGDGFKVVYSASLQLGRRRFTIAHELAHAVFETTGPNCPRYGTELEQICDMLASELLLPRQIFGEHVGSAINAKKIYELSRVFQASLMATSLRCFKLFGTSVFQVEGGRLVWGYGAVRHQRDIETLMGGSQDTISQALTGVSGETLVYLRGANHICSWANARGQERALFVLQQNDIRSAEKLPTQERTDSF